MKLTPRFYTARRLEPNLDGLGLARGHRGYVNVGRLALQRHADHRREHEPRGEPDTEGKK